VEKFIDTPVKRYSTGMYMRLAFAVAAHIDVEIMVVDEVLAVGDSSFRAKCLGKMKDIGSKEGRTVLFVSHDMGSIRQLCRQVVLLSKGELLKVGAMEEVTSLYEELSLKENKENFPTKIRNPAPHHYHFKKVELRNSQGAPCCKFAVDEVMEVHLWSNEQAPVGRYTVEFILFNSKGNRISWGAANPIQDTYFKKEDTHFVCKLGPLPLTSGMYSFTFVVKIWGMECWDLWEDAISFEIYHCDMFKTGFEITSGEGDFMINQEWESRNGE
jgi:lipopolysaccharide transport system ATP-binding protein